MFCVVVCYLLLACTGLLGLVIALFVVVIVGSLRLACYWLLLYLFIWLLQCFCFVEGGCLLERVW